MTNQEVLAEMRALSIATIQIWFDYDPEDSYGQTGVGRTQATMPDGEKIELGRPGAFVKNGEWIHGTWVDRTFVCRPATPGEIAYAKWRDALEAPVEEDENGNAPDELDGTFGFVKWNAIDNTCQITATRKIVTYSEQIINL